VVTEDKENTEPLVEQRSASSSASVRSILKAAISRAEQIVDSVKAQVETEARQEAEKIITEAKKEAEKIRSEKRPARKEPAEDIVAIAEPVAEEEVAEPAPAPEELVTEEEKPEQPESQAEEPVAEEVMSPPEPEAPAVVEPAAEAIEPKKTDKKWETVAKEAPEVVLTKEESQTLYTGEVEINVEVPIEPTMVAKLYNYLQTTPEIKFVRTAGSWNKGSTITIVLEKPIPLLATLVAKLPEANILPERPEGKDHVRDRRGAQRINISLREQ